MPACSDHSIAVTDSGNFVLADCVNGRLLQVTPQGQITLLADAEMAV